MAIAPVGSFGDFPCSRSAVYPRSAAERQTRTCGGPAPGGQRLGVEDVETRLLRGAQFIAAVGQQLSRLQLQLAQACADFGTRFLRQTSQAFQHRQQGSRRTSIDLLENLLSRIEVALAREGEDQQASRGGRPVRGRILGPL